MGNVIAIVGRPNVGKSTFFNRLVGSRDAIVDETSGTTRDRHYGKAEWVGHEFTVIDTGGYVSNSDDVFEEEINKQVKLAIDEADVILFLVDVTAGITSLDESVANVLRRGKKKAIVVVNKVDNYDRINDSYEFHGLGLGDVFCISSMNGSGTGELLDEVIKSFNPQATEPSLDDLPKIAIVGRPNVGKSSLINALIGEDRNIVTPIAGTTRDSVFTRYNKFNHDFYLIDTAGLRKKGKTMDNIEFYSVMRSIKTIEKCDVCLLVLDATRGIEAQDLSILALARKNKKGLVILVNKWDLIEKDNKTLLEYQKAIEERIAPSTDIPIIFISALTKQRIHDVLQASLDVFENRKRRIATSKLNQVMLAAIEANTPPSIKGKFIKIKYVTQIPTPSPSFVFFCNLPELVKEPYKRFLENKLRENFDFKGAPIQIYVREK